MARQASSSRSIQAAVKKRNALEEALSCFEEGGSDSETLQAGLENASHSFGSLNEDLNSLKDQARSLKRDIAEWKDWFEGLSELRKPEEISKLQIEISRLASALSGVQAQIAVVVPKHFAAMAAVEQARARLEGLQLKGEEADAVIKAKLRRKISAAKGAETRARRRGS